MLNSLVLNVSWLSICSAYLFVYNRFLSLFFLNISWLNESMTMRWLCGWEDVKISYCLFLLFKTKYLLFLKILILTNLTDCSTDSIFNQGSFYCFLFTTITTTIPVSAVRLQHATCKWGCVLLQNCGPDLYLLGVSCFEADCFESCAPDFYLLGVSLFAADCIQNCVPGFYLLGDLCFTLCDHYVQKCGPYFYLLGDLCFTLCDDCVQKCRPYFYLLGDLCFTLCDWLFPELWAIFIYLVTCVLPFATDCFQTCEGFLFTWWLVFYPLWWLCPELWGIFIYLVTCVSPFAADCVWSIMNQASKFYLMKVMSTMEMLGDHCYSHNLTQYDVRYRKGARISGSCW